MPNILLQKSTPLYDNRYLLLDGSNANTTINIGSEALTTTGSGTFGSVTVDLITLDASTISFTGPGTIESNFGGALTLSNTNQDSDIVFSTVNVSGTNTMTLDASDFSWVSSSGVIDFQSHLMPSGSVNIGEDTQGGVWNNIVADNIFGIIKVNATALNVSATSTLSTTIIDVTGTEALLVRKDTDAGDVLIVDTTNSRVGINKTPTVDLDVLGNPLITLTGTGGNRFEIDGSTNKVDVGNLVAGYNLTNTFAGDLSGGSILIGLTFSNTMESSLTGSNVAATSRGLQIIHSWGLTNGIAGEGSVTKDSVMGVSVIENSGMEFSSRQASSSTIDNINAGILTFNNFGAQFSGEITGTISETSGSVIVNNIGGKFRARSFGVPVLNDTPEINYIGVEAQALMPTQFSSIGTSIGGRFFVEKGNDNIGIRVLAIDDANNENIGLDIEAITGATTIYAIRTSDGPSLFGDKLAFTQTDLLEYIDSDSDGDLDIHATTSIDLNIGGSEIGSVNTNGINLIDANFLIMDKASGNGIKVDTTTPTFGFRDIIGDQFSKNTGATKPTLTAYNGVINSWLFGVSDEAYISYHIPHDYVAGTPIFLHVHWSHIVTTVTGGTVTFKLTSILAKAHNQQPFQSTPSVGTFTGTASTVKFQQILSEVLYSDGTPTGLEIDTADLEPDSVIELTFEVDANNITVSSGGVPDIFVHFVDIHYQSTNIGTKDKVPDFYA